MATQSYTIYVKYAKQPQGSNKCKPNTESVNKTIPKADNGTKTSYEKESSTTAIGFINAAKNPMGTLIGSAAKAFAPIAVGLACVKVADSIVQASLPIYEGLTGDYTVSLNYSNFKSAINAIVNPFSTATSYIQKQIEIYRENLKVEEQRALTGNSTINTYGGKSSN